MHWIAGATAAPAGSYDADVVILSLNRARETVAAIASALGQTGISAHVFVVDQGSDPHARSVIAATVAGRSDVTFVGLDRNYGVAGGRNRGSALGHGRVIVGLDNDAEFAGPDTLRSLVAALDADAGLAVIACRIVRFDTGEDDVSSWGYPRGLLPYAGRTFETDTFVGAGHAIRRSAWDAAGGYDPALFFCWEEYDFSIRTRMLGWRIRYRGDLVVRHKVSAEGRVTWSANRWFFHVRNRLYIGRKYGDSWIGLTPRMIGYVLKGLRNGLVGETLRAIRQAIRMEPTRPLPEARPYHATKADRSPHARRIRPVARPSHVGRADRLAISWHHRMGGIIASLRSVLTPLPSFSRDGSKGGQHRSRPT